MEGEPKDLSKNEAIQSLGGLATTYTGFALLLTETVPDGSTLSWVVGGGAIAGYVRAFHILKKNEIL